MEEEQKTIYGFLYDLIGTILKTLFHYTVVFIRMTIYYIVKLIYKIFRLREIDLLKERAKLDNQESLTTFKHEFVFDKSNEFINQWIYYKELVEELDLEDENKAELIQYVLKLISESERQAFNTTYNYMLTKDFREPSFEDMVIQGIFKNNSDVEPRCKLDNPYRESLGDTLRHRRKQKI